MTAPDAPAGRDAAIVAVLAGGGGSRIGGAKPTQPLAGRSLIAHALDAPREAGLETVVVAKRDTSLPPLAEHVIEEPDEPRHPLCGALAALDYAARRSPALAVVLVACDMPFLTAGLLLMLAGLDGAALLELDGKPQPLPARCLPEHAPALRDALARESSLRAAFAALQPQIVDERELRAFGDPRRLLFGVNTAEDLARAGRWLAPGTAAG